MIPAELRWIARKDKDLSLPTIKFVDDLLDDSAIASYWSPTIFTPESWREEFIDTDEEWLVDLADKNILCLGDELISIDRGLLVVDLARCDDSEIESAIAHEWRHHWQTFNMPAHYPISWPEHLPYDEALQIYYADRFEADALAFECSVAPNDGNRYRASLLGWPCRRRAYSFLK
jgi:hypothetical protein